MPENNYRKAMDKVSVSPDLEERMAKSLERRLKEDERPLNPRRRPLRVAAWASAAVAAALVIALVVPGVLPLERTVSPVPDATNALSQTVGGTVPSVPDATGALVAAGQSEETSSDPDVMDAAAAPAGESAMAPVPALVAPAQAGYNTEEYNFLPESGFKSVLSDPLSTFAADVDTASYANIRRMLLAGETPPADAVRIEEMLNYFRYDYPAPKEGEPFSVTTEIAPCPWNKEAKLLMVGLQAKEIDSAARPACNLVFLIDVSGSMDGPDRLELAQKAFLMLTEQLKAGDRVSIVTYAGSDSVLLEGATVEDRPKIVSALENLKAGGSTAGSEGILTAYRIAREQFIDGGVNRVILATDGDLNVGVTSEGELTRLIEQEKESGVFLSVMGFGTGNYKDNKLEALADHGNGNYSCIDSALEARKVLVEEMGSSFFTVCKDAKFQIEFNPEKVVKYRQIGYENRALANQDFADDTKDGGEIGADHRVTVLYEILEAGGGAEPESGLKYQTSQSTGSSEFCTVSVRAKEPEGDVSKLYSYPVGGESVRTDLSDNLRFAAAVAETGMLLRGSEYAGSASYQSAADLLAAIPSLSQDPYKDEFAYLVRTLSRGRIGQ